MVTVWLATVIVPVRVALEVLDATVNVTVPLPLPELPETVTHEVALVEDHPQPAAAVTLTLPLPPFAAIVKLVGLTA